MVVFAKVIESGSLTAAAKALHSSRSAVSKAIARLERHLKTRLLHRTTRELSPTAAGLALHAHCARIAAEAEIAERVALDLRDAPRGRLSVSCALSLGLLLAPVFPRFLQRCPEVSLELSLSDSLIDLVRAGVDLGVRLGKMSDSSLVARKLASYRRVICASPMYLAAHSKPTTPEDLAKHRCLLRLGEDHWRLRTSAGMVSVPLAGGFRADTPEPLRQAALAGMGLVLLPSFIIAEDLARGRLISVLEDHVQQEAAIYAVYPHQRHLSPAVRAFIDFLVEAVAQIDKSR
jgi:DNA-binding transcriptional LysR family regulator